MPGGVPTRLHAQSDLPQGSEKLLLRDILCLKRRSCLPPSALYSDWIAKANITVESPSKWTSTTHVVETSESIEPTDTNLEVNAIGYTFSKIHILAWNVANKLLQFARRSWTALLRLSSPQRQTGKLKKLFLSCGRFHSLLVAFMNAKTLKHSEIKQTRPSTKQHFSGEALSKQNTEAELASFYCRTTKSSNGPTVHQLWGKKNALKSSQV